MRKRKETAAEPRDATAGAAPRESDADARDQEDDDEDAGIAELGEADAGGASAGADGDGDGEKAIKLLEPDEAGAARAGAGRGPGRLSTVRDSVGRFLAEARRYKRLSEQEERALGVAARERGDMNAARTLVVHNLRLVISIAYQYRRAWTNILDLFQEGSVGLMEAVKRWEPKLGPRFGTYAAYWIRAYVLRFLMTNSRLIHVGNTRAGRKLFFRLERERQKLLAAGIDVTPKLLAAKLDVDEKDLDEVRQHLESREVPFDPRPGESRDDEGYALSERLAGGGESPEVEAARAELATTMQKLVAGFRDSLTEPRERAVWLEHLAAEEPVALSVLGARFGVTKQRMGQIADQLKKRFRAEIVAKLGPEVRTDWLGGESD
ncbi:MAG TPA: sigma-70 family RNA polymerase sigma factor [Polyangia bacterium]|jgi:RNA polymerase sigma-32 factor